MPIYRRRKQPIQITTITDCGNLGFDYQLRRSGRQSISIQVRNGEVRLAAPYSVDEQALHNWLLSKAPWVTGKIQQQRAQRMEVPRRLYCTGEYWSLLDQQLKLTVSIGAAAHCEAVGDNLQVTLSNRSRKTHSEQVRAALERWYQQQAREILTVKTGSTCDLLGITPKAIHLRRTRSKWGHCTPSGEIQYNWLIVQAPEWVIDYLVVHECCHRIHMNHSKSFWSLVESLMPNYKQARKWLKINGHRLSL